MKPPSPLDVAVCRAGRIDDVTLHLASTGVTIGDVAAALGLSRRGLDVDGRPVDGTTPVVAAGLRRGAVLDGFGHSSSERPGPPAALVRWIGGLDAGRSIPLTPGSYVIGRAAGVDVRTSDPDAAPFGAVLDAAPDGAVSITPTAPGCAPFGPGRWRIGASLFEIGPARPVVPVLTGHDQPGEWTVPLSRPPRPVPRPHPGGVAPCAGQDGLAARIALSGLVTTLLSLAGGVMAAVLLGQPAFLLLGGTAAIAGIGGWIAQRRRGRRESRTATRRAAADRARFASDVAERRAAATTWVRDRAVELADAVGRATTHDRRLWERRPHHDDAFEVVIGRAAVPWGIPVDGTSEIVGVELDDAPVTMRLDPGVGLGLVGVPEAVRAIARSLVIQLAVTTGPADLAVSVVADDAPGAWGWTAWLPHHLAFAEDAHRRMRLLVVDAADALSSRTSDARAALAGRDGPVAGVVVARRPDLLPACCTHVVEVAGDGRARVLDLATGAVLGEVAGAGASTVTAAVAARALARFDDPELVRPDARLPATVDAMDLLGPGSLDPVAVREAWDRSGRRLRVPLAVAADGVVDIDLVEHGPHALVAGTTGAGKSELLRALVVGLAVRASPVDVSFVLIDYKGGSAFDACADLPHVVGAVTDLDERLAERALRSLHAELRRRERVLRVAGAADIEAYRSRSVGDDEPMPRLVVVVDEFAGLAAELPDFLTSLVGVAQRGRSLGIHLVLATQRPAGVVNDDIRANTNLRIALRVQDGADSVDVIGGEDAARLARDRPGRAVVRFGAGELVPVQVATTAAPVQVMDRPAVEVTAFGAPQAPVPATCETVLERLVTVVREAARAAGLASPRRPWLDPLPADVDLHSLPDGHIALADDPDVQAQYPVAWDQAAGHLLLFGSPGSGTTTALQSVALGAARCSSPDRLHVYAVDMGAGGLQPLAALPHCGGVVRATERERLVRLVRRLRSEVDARDAARVDRRPDVLLLVDGLEALRSRFDDPAGYDVLDALDAVIQEGPDVGIRMVATADRAGALPGALTAAIGSRWIFRLADPADARSFGVAPGRLVGVPPGRAVVAVSGLEIQVARPAASLADAVAVVAAQWPDAGHRAAPVGVLPAVVPAATLPIASATRRPWSVPIGIGDADLEPAHLVLHAGDHALVTGRARTGRSSALALLADSLRRAQPDAVLGAAAFRPSRLRDLADVVATDTAGLARLASASVVLVDDAELVSDDGTLAELLARPDRHVIAAVHPDVLRSSYGHWAHAVRRSRLGVVLQPDVDVDGDLLGASLPRRQVVPVRPGCGYLVVDGRAELVQLARVA